MSGSLLDAIESWPEPNYDDPVTRGPGLVVAGAVFGALGTVLVALRVYTRLRITSTFGLDDAFIIIAGVGTVNTGKGPRLTTIDRIIGHDGGQRHCFRKVRLESTYLGCPILANVHVAALQPHPRSRLYGCVHRDENLPPLVLPTSGEPTQKPILQPAYGSLRCVNHIHRSMLHHCSHRSLLAVPVRHLPNPLDEY